MQRVRIHSQGMGDNRNNIRDDYKMHQMLDSTRSIHILYTQRNIYTSLYISETLSVVDITIHKFVLEALCSLICITIQITMVNTR